MARDRFSLLVLDGELPPLSMIADLAKSAERVVCTDGVARHLEFLEEPVSAIVGDMDSLDDIDHFAQQGVEIIHKPSQYANDFEKALDHLIERGAHHVLIIGLGGKRLDHTLTNVSVMKRFTPQFSSLVAIDQYGLSYILIGPAQDHKIEARENTLVSLTPITNAAGVTTRGLYYPLSEASMVMGEQEGLSNICTSADGASVSLASGAIMITIVTNP
jgi:thiamine pyrophosphokinase